MIDHGQGILLVFKQSIDKRSIVFLTIKCFFFSLSDLIVTSESRPPTVANSSRTINNGRTSAIPPPSDYEMIIGLLSL